MRSVIIVSLSSFAACATEPPLEPIDCGSSTTFQIDSVVMPRNNSAARESGLDLNVDGTVDNQLGMVVGTLNGQLGTAFDLDASAAEHLATDTDWRLTVWRCPADQRLVALTDGPGDGRADLRGGLQGQLFVAYGDSGLVPLGALFDADGGDAPEFVQPLTTAVQLVDPSEDAEELEAIVGLAVESNLAASVVVRALAPYINANLSFGRGELDKNGDGTITEAELGDASITHSLLAPDIRVGDTQALSLGLRVHATRVR